MQEAQEAAELRGRELRGQWRPDREPGFGTGRLETRKRATHRRSDVLVGVGVRFKDEELTMPGVF